MRLSTRFAQRLMAVALVSSSAMAVSALPASATMSGTQGCTPGYYKNHLDAFAMAGYSPTQTIGSIWTLPAELAQYRDTTLIDALQGGGGSGLDGATQILLRASVAYLLNASIDAIDFPGTVNGAVTRVNKALASLDRNKILNVAKLFDSKNNLGCPLN